jgi:hypothetical protein
MVKTIEKKEASKTTKINTSLMLGSNQPKTIDKGTLQATRVGVRSLIKPLFEGTYSVRCDFPMGRINVAWSDGPSVKNVQQKVQDLVDANPDTSFFLKRSVSKQYIEDINIESILSRSDWSENFDANICVVSVDNDGYIIRPIEDNPELVEAIVKSDETNSDLNIYESLYQFIIVGHISSSLLAAFSDIISTDNFNPSSFVSEEKEYTFQILDISDKKSANLIKDFLDSCYRECMTTKVKKATTKGSGFLVELVIHKHSIPELQEAYKVLLGNDAPPQEERDAEEKTEIATEVNPLHLEYQQYALALWEKGETEKTVGYAQWLEEIKKKKVVSVDITHTLIKEPRSEAQEANLSQEKISSNNGGTSSVAEIKNEQSPGKLTSATFNKENKLEIDLGEVYKKHVVQLWEMGQVQNTPSYKDWESQFLSSVEDNEKGGVEQNSQQISLPI